MIAQLLGRVCLLSVVYTYRFDMDFSVADDHTIGRDKHFLFGLALPTVLYAPAVLMEFFFFFCRNCFYCSLGSCRIILPHSARHQAAMRFEYR